MKKYTTIPQPVILSAITKLEDYIKCTYGAAGRGILIDNGLYQSILDDGFASLEEFELQDELENAVIAYIKEGTRRTNKNAGDANTTFILILCSLIRQAFSNLEYTVSVDFRAIADELAIALPKAIEQMRKSSKKVSELAELEEIACNAYRNPLIAKIVAEVVHKVGSDGIISVETSDNAETVHEIVMGMAFDKGYASTLMSDGRDIELKRPAIIITDEDITQWSQIAHIVKALVEHGTERAVFIVDAISGNALQGALANNLIVVQAPGFAEQKLEILRDIAALTGATVLSKKIDLPLELFTMNFVGTAKSVVVGLEETKIIEGAGSTENVQKRVASIKGFMRVATPNDKKKLEARIAKLVSGIAVIKVGSFTDADARSMLPKVQNAINATKLAMKEGKSLGGGMALVKVKSGSSLLDTALQYPRQILLENGKKYVSDTVYDATGVLVVAVESAVSVANDLITTGGIITNKKEDEK